MTRELSSARTGRRQKTSLAVIGSIVVICGGGLGFILAMLGGGSRTPGPIITSSRDVSRPAPVVVVPGSVTPDALSLSAPPATRSNANKSEQKQSGNPPSSRAAAARQVRTAADLETANVASSAGAAVVPMASVPIVRQELTPARSATTREAVVGQQAAVEARKRLEAITQQLKSGDAPAVDNAVEAIRGMLDDPRNWDAPRHLGLWIPLLIKGNRLDDADKLALGGISSKARDPWITYECAKLRVDIALAQGRPREAMARAKSAYNVCPMRETSRAINLLAQCWIVADPDKGLELSRRFKMEQVERAAPPEKEPAKAETSMLSQIKVDAGPYQRILSRYEGRNSFVDLSAVGNLLLLSDKPSEAHKVFTSAYALVSDRELAVATENLARAMRAADCGVGRANAWLLALRSQDANPRE